MLKPVCLAYACEPNVGSESELGWMWANIIGEFSRPVVITRNLSYKKIPGDKIISRDFGEVKIFNNVIYKNIDIPILNNYAGGHFFLIIHYLIWQFFATIWVLMKKKHFDVAHHINFVSAWLPPFVSLVNLPVIWGPIGTGSGLPRWARKNFKAKLWNVVTQNPGLFPFYKYLSNKCKTILPINSHVARLISSERFSLMRTFPAVAFDTTEFSVAFHKPINEATIIYVGRYVPFKFPELAALTSKKIKDKYPNSRFIMIGDGLKEALSSCHQGVEFVEKMERADFLRFLSSAQLMLLPTTEGSSYIALEAMSVGLPIVTTENSGPAYFIGDVAGKVTEHCASEDETAISLARNCEDLLLSQSDWETASRSALLRSALFTKKHLKRNIESVYAEVMSA